MCGFSSGYALKKVGKIAAVGIGIGFMSIQLLHYYGIIGEVKWDRVQNALVTRLDTDGDGKVTWNVSTVLSTNAAYSTTRSPLFFSFSFVSRM